MAVLMIYTSSRNSSVGVSAAKAISQGISEDSGLFVPVSLPILTGNDFGKLKDLNYKYVFMGHDHMPYEPLDLGNTILYRPGSLTRTTVDKYNEKRDIRYYVLETGTMEVYADIVPSLPSSEVYLNGSFAEKEVARHKAYNDRANIGKLLARFDRQLTSNISLEDVLRKGKVPEDIIMYLRDLHRLHNIKYN